MSANVSFKHFKTKHTSCGTVSGIVLMFATIHIIEIEGNVALAAQTVTYILSKYLTYE